MAEISRTALKAYFETGDKPTEAQYIDLIDSMFNFNDDTTTYAGLTFKKTAYANKSASFTHAYAIDTMVLYVLIKRTLSNPTVKCGTSAGTDDIFRQRTIDPTGEYYTITLNKSFANSGTLYFTVAGGTVNVNIFYLENIM